MLCCRLYLSLIMEARPCRLTFVPVSRAMCCRYESPADATQGLSVTRLLTAHQILSKHLHAASCAELLLVGVTQDEAQQEREQADT